MEQFISVKNNETVSLKTIPVLTYEEFLQVNTGMVLKDETFHCVNYFGVPQDKYLKLYCCIAGDSDGEIMISSSVVDLDNAYPSFTAIHFAFHVFEREIHENYGLKYTNHPWLKPLRYAYNRADLNQDIRNYPFYKIDSEELHEVGVGPIHAGVIEPGHFRFICNGEQILHLEIQLGFQHRGIETLMLQKKSLLERTILAENIAGDTTVGHTTAFANMWESLCGFKAGADIQHARTVALELERMAIHTGDLSAICTDIAYQLGSSVFGRLRTPLINSFQFWCGNRLAKSLIRVGKNQFPISPDVKKWLMDVFNAYEPDFNEMYYRMKNLPSVLARLEKTGTVTKEQVLSIGAVGMAARMSGVWRDVRASHPHDFYTKIEHQPVIKHHGDVYSRTQIRKQEIMQSLEYIRELVAHIPATSDPSELHNPVPDSMVVSLVEGWRGEICHIALTNGNGELAHYKIKDPSLHNWFALALAVRNNEISDFPICNKSFNLSYCGHDL